MEISVERSGLIAEVDYSQDTQTLTVGLRCRVKTMTASGIVYEEQIRRYTYEAVPFDVYTAFMDAPSMGSFYATDIKGNHAFVRADEGAPQAPATQTH